jgi:hypothetical protein
MNSRIIAVVAIVGHNLGDELACATGLEQATIAEQHPNAVDCVAVNGSTVILRSHVCQG